MDTEYVTELSDESMSALREFLEEQREKDIKAKEISELKHSDDIRNVTFEEDWQLSQFWYDENTATSLALVASKLAGESGNIALISCPTVYKYVKKIAPNCKVTLLEHDKRFAVYREEFTFYDYKNPLDIPRDLASLYDVVIMDPPFLSEECLTKTAVTAKYLAKDKIILCTGAVMEDLAQRLLDMKKCSFVPKHKNNLANEFHCYANFNFDDILQEA